MNDWSGWQLDQEKVNIVSRPLSLAVASARKCVCSMNPVDHPHGGGDRLTSGGRHPFTQWVIPTKVYKTRTINY